MKNFKDKYGPWALITGASRGIGAEAAYQCAEQGLNCIIIARSHDQLKEHKSAIKKKYEVEVKTVSLDLSTPDFINKLAPHIDDLEIGLLINNAGMSQIKPFAQQSLEDLLQQFDLNARASLILTKYLSAKMIERKKGGIIFLSSGSALYGTPYVANYAGTKAYNLILGESLWYEMKKHNIDVLGFMPGSTDTPGYNQHHPNNDFLIKVRPVEKTVKEMLTALGKEPSHIDGIMNRVSFWFLKKLISRKKSISIVGSSMERVFEKELK